MEASMAKTKILGSQINLNSMAGEIHSLASKPTPTDTDETMLVDSAASYAAKRLTWSDIKTTLKSNFDTVYAPGDGWVPAGETWTYGSSDWPEYTILVSGDKRQKYQPGDRIRLRQPTTPQYFLVTGVTYNAPNTQIKVFGGMGFDGLPNFLLFDEPIVDPCYSKAKFPQGFPTDPAVWGIKFLSLDEYFEVPEMTEGVWYDTGLFVLVPTGRWELGYKAFVDTGDAVELALSSSSNSRSHPELSAVFEAGRHFIETYGYITVNAKTTFRLIVRYPYEATGYPYFVLLADEYRPFMITGKCAYI
jgi:hypothetical protein